MPSVCRPDSSDLKYTQISYSREEWRRALAREALAYLRRELPAAGPRARLTLLGSCQFCASRAWQTKRAPGRWMIFGAGPMQTRPMIGLQDVNEWAPRKEGSSAAFFLFLYFLKTFFTKIYFWFHNLQFYTPTARQRGGRGPTARLRGGRPLAAARHWRPAPCPPAGR